MKSFNLCWGKKTNKKHIFKYTGIFCISCGGVLHVILLVCIKILIFFPIDLTTDHSELEEVQTWKEWFAWTEK